MSLLQPSCEEIPLESLPASDTISSPTSYMPASEPFISNETVEHTSNCEFLLKIYHLPSFGSRFHRQNLPQRSPLFTHKPHQIEVSFMRTTRKSYFRFESQSINNFGGYDVSQRVDWECPLCPLMFSWF